MKLEVFSHILTFFLVWLWTFECQILIYLGHFAILGHQYLLIFFKVINALHLVIRSIITCFPYPTFLTFRFFFRFVFPGCFFSRTVSLKYSYTLFVNKDFGRKFRLNPCAFSFVKSQSYFVFLDLDLNQRVGTGHGSKSRSWPRVLPNLSIPLLVTSFTQSVSYPSHRAHASLGESGSYFIASDKKCQPWRMSLCL